MIEFLLINQKLTILRDGQEVSLAQVPEATQAILAFVRKHPQLDAALKASGLVGDEKILLFAKCFLSATSTQADICRKGYVHTDNHCQCETCPLAEAKNKFYGNYQSLTPKEFEVMKRVARGYFIKEIADQLDVTQQTINKHKEEIFKKMDFRSSVELAAYAGKIALI